MPGDPAVSIVLPFRDEAAHVGECLESVRAQTLAGWELLAIDDGSDDESPEIVRAFAADDVMHPDRLAAQRDFLDAHPEIDLVGTQVELFPEEIVRAGYREYVRWQ